MRMSSTKREINIKELEEAYKDNPLWNIWKNAGMSLSDISKTLDINYVTLKDSLYKIQRPIRLMEKFQTANLVSADHVEDILNKQCQWVLDHKNILFYDVLPRTPLAAAVCNSRKHKKNNTPHDNNNGKSNGNGKTNGHANLDKIKSMAYGILSSFYQGSKESYSTVVDYNDNKIFHALNEIKRVDENVDVIIETRMVVRRKENGDGEATCQRKERDHKIF